MLPEPTAFRNITDDRGELCFAELGAGLPFAPQRFFLVHDVPPGTTRGGHAHKHCEQYLVAVAGQVAVTLDDGVEKVEHLLDRPNLGLHVPAGIWGEQRYLMADSCLLVLASEPYDAAEYLTDYAEFLAFRKAQP